MPETQIKKATYELAFGIHDHGDNLYSAKMIKFKDNKISEWKHGNGTLMGHALAIATGLMEGYTVVAHEKSAEEYYNDVQVV